MKLIKCIALFLITGFSAEAQKYELGEVTKQELEEKMHPQDASAPAAIHYASLFYFGHYNFFHLPVFVKLLCKFTFAFKLGFLNGTVD